VTTKDGVEDVDNTETPVKALEDEDDDATTLLRLLGQALLKWQRRRAVSALLAVAVIIPHSSASDVAGRRVCPTVTTLWRGGEVIFGFRVPT
jgi:hypothetical protein